MSARLEARVGDERLTNVESRVMDACSLEFEDDAFDVSASQS
ncbi:MAG: SAM-dependent methyltransferase, partial [Actinomycetota bacterium]|nr:SAM-dependent methyltransferase [Actinomycetota bacterium]